MTALEENEREKQTENLPGWLSQLNEREQRILKRRFGIEVDESLLTEQERAWRAWEDERLKNVYPDIEEDQKRFSEFGGMSPSPTEIRRMKFVSDERIRMLEAKALSKLREMNNKK